MQEEARRFFENEIAGFYDQLHAYANKIACDAMIAADITQETMRIVWEKIDRIRSYSNIEAALIVILKNQLVNYYRKNKHELNKKEIEEPQMIERLFEMDSVKSCLLKEQREELRELVSGLRKEYRILIRLHYYEDLSFREIAILMERNYNTLISWHKRALAELAEKLKTKRLREEEY
ncbi:MAG: RNA polymerase sigma factor [Eubacteriales bacterium]|nr:RNA polymerase sigma factor [Eubacteriales bacterium]MDD3349944.1 RNA polymerase sigma factor [Eubacteriales bacterium]